MHYIHMINIFDRDQSRPAEGVSPLSWSDSWSTDCGGTVPGGKEEEEGEDKGITSRSVEPEGLRR